MAKQTEYMIGPVIGRARNKTLAREDAERIAEEMLDGSYTPVMLAWRGAVGFMWREPDVGWAYKVLFSAIDAFRGYRQENLYANSMGAGGREETILGAKFHMVQGTWISGERDLSEEARVFVGDEKITADLDSWMGWQAAYRKAQLVGLEEHDCREYANSRNEFANVSEYLHHMAVHEAT